MRFSALRVSLNAEIVVSVNQVRREIEFLIKECKRNGRPLVSDEGTAHELAIHLAIALDKQGLLKVDKDNGE